MAIAISTEEFQRFRTLIYDESGISLNDQKQGLVASRLSKRLRELGVKPKKILPYSANLDAQGQEEHELPAILPQD